MVPKAEVVRGKIREVRFYGIAGEAAGEGGGVSVAVEREVDAYEPVVGARVAGADSRD
jgi:hypothetical protein